MFAAIVFAQTPSVKISPDLSPAPPATVGISDKRLKRIDAMLKKAVKDGDIPGAVALIARDGKIVFHSAYGLADNSAGIKIYNDAIFRIASQTKAITSTAVMMLWEEGKFKLDDPVSKYIPEFKNARILDTFNEQDTTYFPSGERSARVTLSSWPRSVTSGLKSRAENRRQVRS